jgi:phosphoenolpyruvate synthase/pyruvate phosphate dikinase
MIDLVLPFAAIDREAVAIVGGKAANLGALAQAGFPVPPGCCVTTEVFRRFMVSPDLDGWFDRLAVLTPDDLPGVREVGEAMRSHLISLPIPAEVEQAIVGAWRELGEAHAYAVRSSATAEDLPGASFAGQQDTYLAVVGREALLDRVRACWASLFTDRAILYRARQGFDHRKVELAVVIQRMVRPQTSGISFTAHPIDGRRHVVVIDAGFGLGEALVSGLVNADLYEVDERDATILTKTIADKRIAIVPRPEGGTERVELDEARRHAQVLDDASILALAQLGKRIEASFGAPQDIEWCIAEGEIHIVQSRPITTLYPLPDQPTDPHLRVYFSFGHVQVMTDVIAPFAHGIVKRFSPIDRDPQGRSRIMHSAGGRLFIDFSDLLRLPGPAKLVPKLLALMDPRTSNAVRQVIDRPEFRASPRRVGRLRVLHGASWLARRIIPRVLWRVWFVRTTDIAERTRARMDVQLGQAQARSNAASDPGTRLRESIGGISRVFVDMFFPIVPSIIAGGLAGALLRRLTRGRVSTDDLAALQRGLRGNVTTQMDLRIGDLADLARESNELVAWLRAQEQPTLAGLAEQRDAGPLLAALERFLAEYGMRGGSEIDVSRPRWRDDPSPLLQVLRGNVAREQAGAHREHHERMTREGEAAAERVVASARVWSRPLVRRLVRAHRDLSALREHPKFQLVRMFALVRAATLAYAAELVAAGRLEQVEDIWWLDVDEVLAVIEGDERELAPIVRERRIAWAHFAQLAPPRVMTSEGEIVSGEQVRGDLPAGALHGTAASAGIVEGVVRVVLDPHRDVLHAGEILVAPFTDPGWTPLFINAAGLIMEVGGLMTHGSVVAREYGIPAVVSVDGATKRLKTGQRVRLDGTAGVIEVLSD